MAFTSAAFVGLTALAVVLYYALPKRAQWCVLLLASLAFYLAGGVKSIVWLVLIILITWTAGLLLGRQNAKMPADKAEKAAIQRRKKIISTFCAISCFGLLFAMKYWNFTLELLPSALGQHIPRWDFLVPLGLSFFIFQSMSYVIDVYRNKQKCEKNVLKYALFVSFFPQMVQGADQPLWPAGPAADGGAQSLLDGHSDGRPACALGLFQKARHRRPRRDSGKQCHFRNLPLRRRCDRNWNFLLLHPAVLRLFRRHRHHARRGAPVRHRHGAEFPPSAVRHIPDRLLAALAHHAGQLDA